MEYKAWVEGLKVGDEVEYGWRVCVVTRLTPTQLLIGERRFYRRGRNVGYRVGSLDRWSTPDRIEEPTELGRAWTAHEEARLEAREELAAFVDRGMPFLSRDTEHVACAQVLREVTEAWRRYRHLVVHGNSIEKPQACECGAELPWHLVVHGDEAFEHTCSCGRHYKWSSSTKMRIVGRAENLFAREVRHG